MMAMMGGIDVDGMMKGMFSILADMALVLAALICAIWSLVLLARRPDQAVRGRRLALIAIGLGAIVESWTLWFFTPWRFPMSADLHWIPLPAFLLGGCALALWATVGSRRWSSTGRLMIAIAVAMVAVGGVLNLRRWDRRREMLYWAEANEMEARDFLRASEADRRCFEHQRRGETCARCKLRRVSEGEADYFLKFAKLRAATAAAYRRAADLGEGPSIPQSLD
jgi:hypothetical protein